MAVYAIGDIQGCFTELQSLLELIRFDPAEDTLWFAGDLVNRGPDSLATLRFVKSLGNRAITVLGNHDLHLIACAHKIVDKYYKSLHPVLEAPDRDVLVDWLCSQPLLHHDEALGFTLVHAGLPPQWDLRQAQSCAQEVESVLRGENITEFLGQMYGNTPVQWSGSLTGAARLRFIVNCLTRLRYCDDQGRLEFSCKGPPGSQPDGYRPWFEIPGRKTADCRIIFGHWSALGACDTPRIFPIDSACLWGGELTALRLDDQPERISLDCQGGSHVWNQEKTGSTVFAWPVCRGSRPVYHGSGCR